MSWNEAFARRYDEWSVHMTEDIAFYVDLAREADGLLVELAIGNGRVAVPGAQATGGQSSEIDSSPAMLEQARAPAPRRRTKPTSDPTIGPRDGRAPAVTHAL
jgi:ubiquinone/menaquinone biosynthesis C-methylase UbiE